MIEVKGADIIAVVPETGQIFPLSMIKDATVTLPEAKDLENETTRIRSLTHSFETTLEAKIISGFAWRYITGTCSNNELRMHHKPMRRRMTGESGWDIRGRWMRRHRIWPFLKEQIHGRKKRRSRNG